MNDIYTVSYTDIDFSDKTILITGGAGFIGSNLAFYFQEKFPHSHIVILDCFRSEVTFANGNLQSFGHYKPCSIIEQRKIRQLNPNRLAF